LLVPVPSLGAWTAFYGAPGSFGQVVYFSAKVWLAVFPLAWFLRAENGSPSLSPLERDVRGLGLAIGLVHGVVLSGFVYAIWLWKGSELVDAEKLRTVLAGVGIASSTRYLVLGAFLAFFNSLIEEYAWRWFVTRQLRTLMGSAPAIVLCALFFAAHHAIAFTAQFGWGVGMLEAGAVFVAGCVWSWSYLRFDSVWPAWISHVMVDCTALAIGWRLLYG
jgi:membrane protease YdiL (CAAX protease family)